MEINKFQKEVIEVFNKMGNLPNRRSSSAESARHRIVEPAGVPVHSSHYAPGFCLLYSMADNPRFENPISIANLADCALLFLSMH